MKASEKFNMQHPLSISLESSGFSEKMVTLEQEQYLISSCKELTFYRDEVRSEDTRLNSSHNQRSRMPSSA